MTENKRFYRNRGTIWENDKSLSLGMVETILNEQHETIQSIKKILNELNNIEEFWDSALLQNYIDKIAVEIGVDLE